MAVVAAVVVAVVVVTFVAVIYVSAVVVAPGPYYCFGECLSCCMY